MKQTISVQSAIIKGDWCNIKAVDGKEYSIGFKDKKSGADKNPILKAAILNAMDVPYNLTGDITDWQGKMFMNDPKPETEKKAWPPARQVNQELIVAQSSIKAACELNRELGLTTIEDVIKEAEKIYTWCMSKSKGI